MQCCGGVDSGGGPVCSAVVGVDSGGGAVVEGQMRHE